MCKGFEFTMLGWGLGVGAGIFRVQYGSVVGGSGLQGRNGFTIG